MPKSHRLSPMLEPKTIALVGGSPRENTVGNYMIKALQAGEYPGAMTVVNPKYESVEGLPCVGALTELETPPDLAILSVAAHRMENALRDAIAAGAHSAVIFDPCFYEGDTEPLLLDRLKAMAKEADFPVCGGNGMGFFNYDSRTFASFALPEAREPGHIAAFCHSGSVFGIYAFADPRFRFNLLTSQGQEIGASVAEYIDYALDQPTTRVIALFIEAVRDPEKFVNALEKANRLGIPVVATKVGRSMESARLAATHSGALAGDDGAFDAVCRRYGVLRTDDLDTMLSTAVLLAMDHQLGDGGLAAILDSGGLREQMMDLAHDLGLEFAKLTPETTDKLRERLAFGLAPVNPLDAAGPVNEDYESAIVDSLRLLADDPNVAMVLHELYTSDTREFRSPVIHTGAKEMPSYCSKPYVVCYSLSTVRNARIASEFLDAGVPLLNGVRPLLVGIKNSFNHRDFVRRQRGSVPTVDASMLTDWQTRLRACGRLGESEGLALLRDFGVAAVGSEVAPSLEVAVEAAQRLGYPVALKTAASHITHKSDQDGVYLGLKTDGDVRQSYTKLSALSPNVTVAEMATTDGVEIAFGMVNDRQFGPVVVIGAGGVLVEVMDDRVFAIPPFCPVEARHYLNGLNVWKLLQGVRGKPACDLDELSRALSQFSVLCAELGDMIEEMDVNPVVASSEGAVAVDCVVSVRQVESANTGHQ